jgi:hypothetical protein
MYMTSGVIGNVPGYQKQSMPSPQAHYSSSHPSKRRRATTSSTKTPYSRPIPPTPTPATHPPILHTHRPSDAGTAESNPSPGDSGTRPTDTNILSFMPPLPSSSLNPPHTNGGALALPFSPSFSFSPLPQFASLAPSPVPRPANLNRNQDNISLHFDPMLSMPTPYEQQPTPGAGSTSGASVHTDPDSKDPFLSLLEQLAENEVSRGGPSELDFFLSGQSG